MTKVEMITELDLKKCEGCPKLNKIKNDRGKEVYMCNLFYRALKKSILPLMMTPEKKKICQQDTMLVNRG